MAELNDTVVVPKPKRLIFVDEAQACSQPFDIDAYLKTMEKKITAILSMKEKDEFTYDILDTEKTKKHKLIALKERQKKMKYGAIWQEVLGNYDSFENLGQGHRSGLDILSNKRKIAMELKNRTNTDNSSSRKANFDKLSKFKKSNPDYTVIYGNVNCDTEEKTIQGEIKIIKHNDVEIVQYIGMTLLNFILGDNAELIIAFVKDIIDKHY